MDTTEKKKKPKTSNAPKMRDKLKSQHNEELFTENSVITENSTKNLPAETAISSLTMEKSLIPWFRITLHIIEIFFSLVVVGYYLLPFLPGTSQLEHFLLKKLVPISLYTGPMDDGLGIFFGVFSLICYYGIPILAVWKIFSVFFTKKLVYLCHPEKIPPMVLNILLSALVIAFILFDVINNASNIGYFFTLAPVTYTFFGLAFAHNLTFVLTLINSFNKKNPVYKEYTEFKKIVNTKKKSGVFKFIVKSGIQRKLLFAFIGLILLVISVLSLTLMSQFKKTVETLIIQNGRALVERSASVIKTNLGDNIAISEYFNLEKKKNESASVKFNSLSFFFKDSASINFFAANSTDESIAGKELKENYKALTDTKTAHDNTLGLYEFITPVTLSHKIIGYVVVAYDSKIIFEPHFRSQIRTILFSVFFLYISVIFVYIIGSNIVFPIHSLRMSVHKISNNLANMIAGKIRVSIDHLAYDDTVRTRDEIKFLSTEFKDMTNVIRGVIPYISASTFKHADQASSSMIKNLAFLFTDMRGFTSFCEGLPPDKVVDVLNRYLDLQAGIILENKGDIDKFIGDEVMAMFEGPEKELNACKASMEIRRAMAKEKKLRESQNLTPMAIGIGINTGPVVFGSVGAKERMDFTSIGDTVNLAARLEGANKSYGTKSLISEAVYDLVRQDFVCREVDLITVKGKKQPVRIYEVLQETEQASTQVLQLKKAFEKALALYRKQKWEEAEAIFKELAKKLGDETSEVFLNRIRHFKKASPPEKWDGVFNLTVK